MGRTASVDQDWDPVEVLEERFQVARKPHLCQECYRDIPVKQQYHCVKYVSDGGFYTYKRCAQCYNAMRLLQRRGHVFAFGGLIEGLADIDLDPGNLEHTILHLAQHKWVLNGAIVNQEDVDNDLYLLPGVQGLSEDVSA